MALLDRVKRAWHVFNEEPVQVPYYSPIGFGSSYRPDVNRVFRNSKSDVNYIYNKISVDVSAVDIVHMRVNDDGKYVETIDDWLNKLFHLRANIDQSGREFVRDIIKCVLDEGHIAIVPIDTDVNPLLNETFKVYSARRGRILEWYPKDIRVEVYDEMSGNMKEVVLPKRICPIIENPFYEVMNEPNSTAKRLMRVLSQLDKTNEANSSGKLDMIIQLPYTVKNPVKRQYAEDRRKEIEAQLTHSQYGIAYVDGTEKIVQLNRSLENNLWDQYQELKTDLMRQLGLTDGVFDGTADEQTMLNYKNETIVPLLTALTEEVDYKWISKTARAQKQAMGYFEDPFKLIPVAKLSEMADKLTRNEIMSSNEVRSAIGMKPSNDPKADELRNANLNHPDEGKTDKVVEEIQTNTEIQNQ